MTFFISHFSDWRIKNPGIFSVISPRHSVKKILQKVWFLNLVVLVTELLVLYSNKLFCKGRSTCGFFRHLQTKHSRSINSEEYPCSPKSKISAKIDDVAREC